LDDESRQPPAAELIYALIQIHHQVRIRTHNIGLEAAMKISVMLAASVLLGANGPEVVNFDKAEVGKPPSGWTATEFDDFSYSGM
jgi:hypothetical protein